MLGNNADERFKALLVRDHVTTSDARVSGGGPQLARQHPYGSCLACSIVAQETEYLAGFHSEGDIVYSAAAVESSGKSVNLDCVHGCSYAPSNILLQSDQPQKRHKKHKRSF